jgi:hypothetical protein
MSKWQQSPFNNPQYLGTFMGHRDSEIDVYMLSLIPLSIYRSSFFYIGSNVVLNHCDITRKIARKPFLYSLILFR